MRGRPSLTGEPQPSSWGGLRTAPSTLRKGSALWRWGDLFGGFGGQVITQRGGTAPTITPVRGRLFLPLVVVRRGTVLGSHGLWVTGSPQSRISRAGTERSLLRGTTATPCRRASHHIPIGRGAVGLRRTTWVSMTRPGTIRRRPDHIPRRSVALVSRRPPPADVECPPSRRSGADQLVVRGAR